MATTEEIRIIIKEEVGKLTKSLEKFNKESKKTQKTTTDTSSSFASMAKKILVASGAFKVLKDSIFAASALEEAQSKFNVVFANTTEQASKSVQELTKSYAMSEREATQYMSSMQDLLVPMGVGENRAAEMSGAIVKLSADLGSFNDMPTETVMNAIQSAMAGNYETMKRYGSMINETRIKQEAMNMGLYNGKGALDASTKAQAAFSLIVKDSSNAIGDMKATQDSFANTVKRIQSGWEDGAATLGQQLNPALKDLAGAMFDATGEGSFFKEIMTGVGWVLSKVVQAITVVIKAYKSLSAEASKNIDINKEIQKEADKNGVSFTRMAVTASSSMETLQAALKRARETGDKEAESLASSAIRLKEVTLSSNKAQVTSVKELEDSLKKLTGTYQVDAGEQKRLAQERMRLREEERAKMAEIAANAEVNAEAQRQREEEANKKANEKKLKQQEEYVAKTTELERRLNKFNQENLNIRTNDYQSYSQFMMRNLDKNNKAQFALYKAFAIQQAIIDTYGAANAAYRALAGIPIVGPGMGAAAAALAVAVGLQRVNTIRKAKAEKGAFLPGTSSGVDLIAGEKNKAEMILPLDDEQSISKFKQAYGNNGGNTINFNGCFFGNEDWPQQVREKIDRELYKLNQDRNSIFAESLK